MGIKVNRRTFLKSISVCFPTFLIGTRNLLFAERSGDVEKKDLLVSNKSISGQWGKYHGFNLLNYFMVHGMTPFKEEEFLAIHKLGFNFVRLPMDYRCWTEENSPYNIKEEVLQGIDKAIEFGKNYGIHVCLNFHRAPGWTVAKPEEKLNLWEEEEALNLCAYHWRIFAERYKDIPSNELSFNLFNEPGNVSAEKHKKVVGKLIEEIRKVNETRPIHCDGRLWGAFPPVELADFGIVANLHMYQPFTITHYKASWAGQWDGVPVPDYPYKEGEIVWDKDRLREKIIKPWKSLEEKGIPIFVGEFGAYNKTPHKAVLKWMEDCLSLFHEAGWGWSLWNFIGPFGPVDSGREDVQYEDWEGHKLDRQMLNLLQIIYGNKKKVK